MRYESSGYAEYFGVEQNQNELEHFGIKGQKWGIRRYQNEDGSLTDEGKRRYTKGEGFTNDNRLKLNALLELGPKAVFKYGQSVRREENAKNPYKRKEGETKEAYKARIKKFDDDEKKKFDAESEKEKTLRDLGKRVNSFDKMNTDDQNKLLKEIKDTADEYDKIGDHDSRKIYDGLMDNYYQLQDKMKSNDLNSKFKNFDSLSTDDKFKMVDELDKEQNKELRENGTSERFETLNKKFHELRYKAGESRCRDIDNMKDGPEKDKKWEQLLADSAGYGQDSEYLPYLIDKMQKTSGDYLSGQYKTEGSRQAGEAVRKLDAEYLALSNEKRQLSSKMFKTSKDMKRISEIDDLQFNFFKDGKYDSAFNKYCEEVLKDMGMPVNEKTIDYITSVIIWN